MSGTLNASLYTRYHLEVDISCIVEEWGPDGAGKQVNGYDIDTIHMNLDTLDIESTRQSVIEHIKSWGIYSLDKTNVSVIDDTTQWSEIQDNGGNQDDNGNYLASFFMRLDINGITVPNEDLKALWEVET